MPNECERLNNCSFFKKHRDGKELACRGFIQQYCKGPKQAECKRKEYLAQHGSPPPDDMMPTGMMMVTA